MDREIYFEEECNGDEKNEGYKSAACGDTPEKTKNRTGSAIVPVAPAPIVIIPKKLLRRRRSKRTIQKHKTIRHFIRRMLKSGIDSTRFQGQRKTLLNWR